MAAAQEPPRPTVEPPAQPTQSTGARERWSLLSRREREVAQLVTRGLSSREIADRLVLSERTVETHIQRIFRKLEVRSRAQLTAWATEQGLSRPDAD